MNRWADARLKKTDRCVVSVWRFGCLIGLACSLMLTMVVPGGRAFGGQTMTVSQPENVFWGAPVLPADLKRVLVLPLACEGASANLAEGCDALNPILLAELIKTQKFEMVSADPETLRRLTGRLTWTGAEALPADFFECLQRSYGCDAVLFCQLTDYHAYPPLAVGWRMKLVYAPTRQILWAVDTLFQNAPTLDKSDRFPWSEFPFFNKSAEQWRQENSPRLFSKKTLHGLLATLPYREESVKVSGRAADVQNGRWSKSRR